MRPFTLPIAGLAVMQGCGGSDSPPASEPQKKNIPMFVERATESGLVFQHRSGASGQYYLPESLGAGCGLFDADGDGDLDALFVRGHNLEELADAESQNRFFRNTGEGQFVDDTTNAGLTDLGYSYGVTCGDVDADGDIDLYITNFGKDCLYYNDGTGRFTKAPEAASVALDDFSVSSCFLDYDRDGDLDLFVTRYLDWSVDIGG
ncbi:MAG: VCBS repeat-containing protein, partial [Phycisphaerales bacterium]|nr:VCBS repeat-containing protein [Phycisphaerales bacterium]